MDADPRLEAIADELYALPPTEFTAARDARAKALRADDKALAKAVGALRRPAVSAWLVDLLVREQGAEVEALLGLGDALRQAQQELAGDALRQLSAQRRQVVAALVQQAAALGRARGVRVSADVELEVESTLEAALADPATAAEVRQGRLVKPLTYAGLGETSPLVAPAPAAVTGPDRQAATQRQGRDDDAQARVDDARARYETARADAEREREAAARARADADAAAGRVDAGTAALERARAERAEAARRLQAAEEAVTSATNAVRDAERDAQAAERAAAKAERAATAAADRAEQARAALEALA